MDPRPAYPFKTKRIVIAQVTACHECCCGHTERGLPDVPVEWLKNEWRKRGLIKRVQPTISGCVGPCDVPNVVVITTSTGTEWLGNISTFAQYHRPLEWAVQNGETGRLIESPAELNPCRATPFVDL